MTRNGTKSPSAKRKPPALEASENLWLYEARKKLLAAKTAYRTEQYDVCQMCVDGARAMENTKKKWEAFVADKHWKTSPAKAPKMEDREDALRFILRFIFGDLERGTKRASEWRLAVKGLRDAGWKDARISEGLQKVGGFKKAAALRQKNGGGEAGNQDRASRTTPKQAGVHSSRKTVVALSKSPPSAGGTDIYHFQVALPREAAGELRAALPGSYVDLGLKLMGLNANPIEADGVFITVYEPD